MPPASLPFFLAHCPNQRIDRIHARQRIRSSSSNDMVLSSMLQSHAQNAPGLRIEPERGQDTHLNTHAYPSIVR